MAAACSPAGGWVDIVTGEPSSWWLGDDVVLLQGESARRAYLALALAVRRAAPRRNGVPLPREVAGYDLWHRRRLSMKPGITGLWQVSGRRDEDFDRWVELDLAYIDRWSLWLDFKIILRTVPAMLQGR